MSDIGDLYSGAKHHDKIVEKIRTRIADGTLKPGEKINQRDLAVKLGITTTPLREALSTLEQEGSVKRIEGLGIFVRRYTLQEIKDFYLLRQALEGMAARLCAERATQEQVKEMRSLAHNIEKARRENNPQKVRKLDITFHELIAGFSSSPMLKQELKRMSFIRLTNIQFSGPIIPPSGSWVNADHTVITRAIQDRDPARAERLMRRHVEIGLRQFLKVVEARRT